MAEKNGGETVGGTTYDDTVYTVTVKVEDDGKGKLVATADKAAGQMEFTNTYTASGDIEIAGTKSYNRELKGDDFEFTLTEVNVDGEAVENGYTETVKNDVDGSFKFGKISYAEAGTYYYEVAEVNGGETVGGTTYDDAVYTVTVKVEDDGNGKLIATADKTPAQLTFTNTYTASGDIEIAGTKSYNKDLAGDDFEFTLTEVDADGNVVENGYTATAKNDTEGSFKFDKINYSEAGTYYYKVSETNGGQTINGTTYDSAVYTVTVTVTDNGDGTLTAVADKTAAQVEFRNTYSASGELTLEALKTMANAQDALAAFTFDLKDADGKVIGTVTNDGTGKIAFPKLTYDFEDAGKTFTYTVSEQQPQSADMYIYDQTIYTVAAVISDNGDGTLKVDTTVSGPAGSVPYTPETMKFVNDVTLVKISKVDITDSKELAGAHIQILDRNGNVVVEWDSTDQPYEAKGLKTGETYTLRETVAPNGYTVTVDTTFELNQDGSINTEKTTTTSKDGVLLVEDDVTSVKINKVDAVDGRVLAGAHLQLFDEAGQLVTEWDSTAEAYELRGLVAGKTYTLHETVAPAGYVVNTVDVTFTLDARGEIDATKTTAKVSADGIVLVENNMVKSENASISVTKKLTLVGAPMAAVDQTFYVALYADEACTNRISDVKPIVFRNTSVSTVEFTGLDVGRTYYVGECDASGTMLVSGVLADGSVYSPNFAEGNQATVTDADGVTTVTFENEFFSMPPGFYRDGWLTITKRLVGIGGEDIESDEVFYAGIFDDAAYTKLSEQTPQNIVPLELNGNSSVSAEVIVSIPWDGTSATVYVTEVDENGVPVSTAQGFMYEVSVDQTKVTLNKDNPEASVTITNREYEEEYEEYEEEYEEETEIETETEKSVKSVKTGDDTPVIPYAMAQIASAFILVLLWYRRRRLGEK